VDVGPTAVLAGQPGNTWSEPRRTLYQYNWARSGATSATLLSTGQHTGLASDVVPEGITHVAVIIGANDFIPQAFSGAYWNIYFGSWSSATIDSYVAGVVANIETALDTLVGEDIPMVVATVPDYGLAPLTQGFLTDAARRQLVADAIAEVNVEIDQMAQDREIVVIDIAGAAEAIFGSHASPKTSLLIGNVPIYLAQSDTAAGGNPDAAFVDDGIHPNTTLQGLFANLVIQAFNTGYDTGLALFSEEEILDHRSLGYVGPDTLASEIGNYSSFVSDYTPVPVPVPSLSSGGIVLLFTALCSVGMRRLSRGQRVKFLG